jgi:glutathione S-transferase
VKLNESLVLVEFIADLYPESGLHPKDPVKLARARLFIDAVSNKFVPAEWAVVMNGADPQRLVEAMEHIQSLLPPEGFAVGEFSIADIAIAPFLPRTELFAENDLGGFPEGEGYGQRILNAIRTSNLARFHEYWKDLVSRPSFASTYNRISKVDTTSNMLGYSHSD